MSHIYSLVVICHLSMYRGDRVVTLPKFEIASYLNAVQKFKISTLYLVSGELRDRTGVDSSQV